ncbi:MAG TPA: M23 family metallopeptidase [Kofleriaceae bacterium]|jgi:murein DD-endopeptidase MepM/ murein hydrolase activator NlpD
MLAPLTAVAQPHTSADTVALAATTALTTDSRDLDLSMLRVDPLGDGEIGKSSGFGWRDDPIRHTSRFHGGTDLRAHYGTPIFAAGDGTVVFAGRQSGYGNVVYIDHGGGIVTRYGHMQRIGTHKDAIVTAGDRIGQVGSTGRATGPHLHFEVRIDGRAVNPVDAMAVAALMRTDLAAGRAAAEKLAPEIQAHVRSDVDPPKTHKETRPDRANAPKRSQALW